MELSKDEVLYSSYDRSSKEQTTNNVQEIEVTQRKGIKEKKGLKNEENTYLLTKLTNYDNNNYVDLKLDFNQKGGKKILNDSLIKEGNFNKSKKLYTSKNSSLTENLQQVKNVVPDVGLTASILPNLKINKYANYSSSGFNYQITEFINKKENSKKALSSNHLKEISEGSEITMENDGKIHSY